MLSAPSEFSALKDEAPPCYWDVRLRTSRRTYLQLMRHLVQIGLVRYVPKGRAREFCGLFFVKKKGGHLRVIIVARRSNRRFAAPPGVEREEFAHLDSS